MWLFSACTFRPVLVMAYFLSVSAAGAGAVGPAARGAEPRGEPAPGQPRGARRGAVPTPRTAAGSGAIPDSPGVRAPVPAPLPAVSMQAGGGAGPSRPESCTWNWDCDPNGAARHGAPGSAADIPGIMLYFVYLLYRMGVCRRVVAWWFFSWFCFICLVFLKSAVKMLQICTIF